MIHNFRQGLKNGNHKRLNLTGDWRKMTRINAVLTTCEFPKGTIVGPFSYLHCVND